MKQRTSNLITLEIIVIVVLLVTAKLNIVVMIVLKFKYATAIFLALNATLMFVLETND